MGHVPERSVTPMAECDRVTNSDEGTHLREGFLTSWYSEKIDSPSSRPPRKSADARPRLPAALPVPVAAVRTSVTLIVLCLFYDDPSIAAPVASQAVGTTPLCFIRLF